MGSSVLEQHGTKLHRLKPASIAAAARADLRRLADKLAGDLDRLAPYAFHRYHVRRARDVPDLIDLALRDRARGLGSGKRETRTIYGDEEALFEALLTLRLGPPRAAEAAGREPGAGTQESASPAPPVRGVAA